MKHFVPHCVLAALAAVAIGPARGVCQPKADENASVDDRAVVAGILKKVLGTELAKPTAKLTGSSAERHKIEKPLPLGQNLVTYWRSSVEGSAAVVEPESKLVVEVPRMVKGKESTVVSVKLSSPLAGLVSGKATTDDGKVSTGNVNSTFKSNLTVVADLVVTDAGKDGFKIEVKKCSGEISGTNFDNAILEILKSEVEKVVNQKLAEDAGKFKEQINSALKTAAVQGKLTLPK